MRSLEVPVYVQNEVDDLYLAECNSTIFREIERNLKERLRHEIKPECLDCKHSQVTRDEHKLYDKMRTVFRLRASCLHVERAGKCVREVKWLMESTSMRSRDDAFYKKMFEGDFTTPPATTGVAEGGSTTTREAPEESSDWSPLDHALDAARYMPVRRVTTPRYGAEFSGAELRELEKIVRPKDCPRTEGFGDW